MQYFFQLYFELVPLDKAIPVVINVVKHEIKPGSVTKTTLICLLERLLNYNDYNIIDINSTNINVNDKNTLYLLFV